MKARPIHNDAWVWSRNGYWGDDSVPLRTPPRPYVFRDRDLDAAIADVVRALPPEGTCELMSAQNQASARMRRRKRKRRLRRWDP